MSVCRSKKVVCLMGPTASGKTAIASTLLAHFPFEIISVDSTLVYTGMNIGTAKPTPEELLAAPHRLIDLCDPAQAFSSGDFCQHALCHIQQIHERGKVPLLVGGTMQYFKRLLCGMAKLPAADLAVRAEIENEAKAKGWQALHADLEYIDPQAFQRIHPNDPQRIQRALEVYRLTGHPMSQLQQDHSFDFPYDVINVIIRPQNRATLHKRIEQRLQAMFSNGLIEEVQTLFQREDIHADLPAIRSVGYRQAWQYLAGEIDLLTCQAKALYATRQLAKRQLTWLRKWPDGQSYYMEELENDLQPLVSYLRQSLES